MCDKQSTVYTIFNLTIGCGESGWILISGCQTLDQRALNIFHKVYVEEDDFR